MTEEKKRFAERTGASGGTSGRPASGFDTEQVISSIVAAASAPKAEGPQLSVEAPALVAAAPVPPAAAPTPNVVALSPPNGFVRVQHSLVGERTSVPITIEVPKPKTEAELLVEQLDAVEKRANVNLEGTDRRTLPGRQAAKREAEEQLAGLQARYRAFISGGLAALFLAGEPECQQTFVSLLKNAPAPVLTIGADEVYAKIASEIEPFMRTDRMFEPGDYARMLSSIVAICRALGLGEAPRPIYRPSVLKDTAAVIDHVRTLIREECGDSLNRFWLAKRVADAAWQIRYKDNVVPVAVTGATEDETRGLASFFNNRTLVVPVDADTNETSMFRSLKALKNKLSKKA